MKFIFAFLIHEIVQLEEESEGRDKKKNDDNKQLMELFSRPPFSYNILLLDIVSYNWMEFVAHFL